MRHQSPKRLRLLLTLVVLVFLVYCIHPRRPTFNPALKIAYATLLLPNHTSDLNQTDADAYFYSTRLLNFQLQHDKQTRTTRGVPFLVLVPPDLQPWKHDQLTREGARIIEVERINVDWLEPGQPRWRDIMTKLRLFQLIEYNRILFLDADTFLFKSLDGIFNDPAAQSREVGHEQSEIVLDEAPLPRQYLFASSSEVMHTIHSYPPLEMPSFNAGFFVLSPSLDLFEYYTSLLARPGKFDTTYPEQNLLNYAHRQGGNMPWARLHRSWNIQLPQLRDVRRGVASVHAKLWTPGNELQPIERELQDQWHEKAREMEIYFMDDSERNR